MYPGSSVNRLRGELLGGDVPHLPEQSKAGKVTLRGDDGGIYDLISWKTCCFQMLGGNISVFVLVLSCGSLVASSAL